MSPDYTAVMQANWPFVRTQPTEGDAFYDFFNALAVEYDYYDSTLDTLKTQRQLQNATGEELDKLALEVGISRETGESDDRLRFRARVAKAATQSDGTFEDVAELLDSIFGDDAKQITLEQRLDEPVVDLNMPSTLLNDIPVSSSVLVDLLDPAIPNSDRFEVITTDTFLFGQSGNQGLGNGGLL